MLLSAWVASAAGEVTVATDKAVYTVGEDITITIHNDGPGDVDFCAWPLFAIISHGTGFVVYGYDRVAQSTTFPAGHGEQFTPEIVSPYYAPWQTYYVILNVAHWLSGPETQYELRPALPVTSPTWGAIRALYR